MQKKIQFDFNLSDISKEEDENTNKSPAKSAKKKTDTLKISLNGIDYHSARVHTTHSSTPGFSNDAKSPHFSFNCRVLVVKK